jgi:adenosine kinase
MREKDMQILITGSIAFDYLMSFPGHFKEHLLPEHLEKVSLSFLVDTLIKRRGGIAPNIAYTMALLGGQASVMGTAGSDFGEYGEWLTKQGVDISNIKVMDDKLTASFFATTDQSNAQIASFFPGAMADAPSMSLKDIEQPPDLILVSPNDPAAMDKVIQESNELGIPYIYDPSQQIVRVDGETLMVGVEAAHGMFANEYEFELVKDKTGLSLKEILGHLDFLVVTLGPKGAIVYHGEGEEHIKAVPETQILDPTGGGDAFRGGFLTAYRHGLDWRACGRAGALAATFCLENEGPQTHYYTVENFVERYKENFADDDSMSVLINSN